MEKKRLTYIDALRGLAMLLVVVSHVIIFTFDNPENKISKILNDEFQIPLFFMVSGLLFKVPVDGVCQMLRHKACMLCVPASIFMLTWVWATQRNLYGTCFDSFKSGYWFTFQLFEFIVLYTVMRLVLRSIKLGTHIQHLLLTAASVAVLFAGTWFTREEHNMAWIPLLGLIHLKSFPYFVLGAIMAERGLVCKSLETCNLKRGGHFVALFLIMHIYTYSRTDFAYLGSSTLWTLVLTSTALAVVFLAFKRYASWSECRLGKGLQFMGRYTLDIYFIHYFLLPRNLSMVGEWFRVNPNPIIEYALALAIAVVVIGASLLVGRIIRLSPALAYWLLGEKKRK